MSNDVINVKMCLLVTNSIISCRPFTDKQQHHVYGTKVVHKDTKMNNNLCYDTLTLGQSDHHATCQVLTYGKDLQMSDVIKFCCVYKLLYVIIPAVETFCCTVPCVCILPLNTMSTF